MAGTKRALAATLVLSVAGLAAISQHEGRVKTAYRDPVGIVTICDGHTKTAKMGQVATDAICDELLRQDTAEAQASVKARVKVPVTQEQYDALVDFVFNKGDGNFGSSTLLRKINSGDCWGAGAEFPRWNQAKGQVLPGLVKRAAHQRKLWESGCAPRVS